MMKRSPVLRNAPSINFDDAKPAISNAEPSVSAPAVSQLASRVSGMKGNTIVLPVCGRNVAFTLKVIAAPDVESKTIVFSGNERNQALLSETSLDDLIPSFLTSGQQIPAFAREHNGNIEVADGSRRRKAAILTGSDYKVLVGNLNDEQMLWLSQIANEYRPTSAYERGLRYAQRLISEFEGNISKLAEAEHLSRKIIQRCIKTAGLPLKTIQLFANPNELSARSGEALSKAYENNVDTLKRVTHKIMKQKQEGRQFTTEELIVLLMPERKQPENIHKKSFGKNIEAKYSKDNVSFYLKSVPESLVKQIEELLNTYAKEHSL
ncbi:MULTISPECIES: ParB/RepB/Spo0J family plasmid partition protein [Yersinia pseudotuberculosis complex]|nr:MULTISPECIES: ParB/RepB/Spo0J family plasmid partition protein [Bacteria]EDR30377.1 plasmid partition protein, ParB family [Yersinia pestis biovar Orientalis str. IP275]ETO48891.1 chromosome partitioning protein ParB [Yersinia pestis S3]CQD59224.1 plasmid-partitioning protein [Yersinia intermedia]ABG16293.1 plasmid partitioning control protein [Yersinia pestis Antiqua]ABP42346.1 plasmid partitioning control protein [Yersinia pestis Pestoides F]